MKLSAAQQQFAQEMLTAATISTHIWPGYAAAETCLESAWGASKLCIRARDVFGLKVPSDWVGATITIPTLEFLNNQWVTVSANWPVFDTYSQAFTERMHVLERNPIYANALAATSGEDFIIEVSKHWSTDPNRGQKVLEIYTAHSDLFTPLEAA